LRLPLTQKPVDEVVELCEDASCLFRSDWPGENQRAAVTAKHTGPITTSTEVKAEVKIFIHTVLMLLVFAAPAFAGSAAIPSSAISSGDLAGAGRWEWNHDKGTPGTSTGYSSYPVSNPSVDGKAREFSVSYWHYGGEIYHLTYGNDRYATHFVYDTYILLANPDQVQNLELDVNQVMSNGKTVIFGTQCSSISKRWDYAYQTYNKPHWRASNLPCNPRAWAANKWHHVQIGMHRSSTGVVTHDWVTLDGSTQYFENATASAALSLGWGEGTLILNMQVDGEYSGSGSIKGYLDKVTMYRW
jgi:hypothetical protein